MDDDTTTRIPTPAELRPPRPLISDERLKLFIGDELKRSAEAQPFIPVDVYLDLGALGIGPNQRNDPTRARAVQLAEAAGWVAEVDGRSGHIRIRSPR